MFMVEMGTVLLSMINYQPRWKPKFALERPIILIVRRLYFTHGKLT